MNTYTALRGCRILPGILSLFILFFLGVQFSGCGGDDETETVVIELVPTSLDFDSSNKLYLVERPSRSIWRFNLTEEPNTDTGVLYPPSEGGFTPWGLATDARRQHDILFVTDVTASAQRLLALDNGFGSEILSDSTILAQISHFDSHTAGGVASDQFSQLRGVAAYALVEGGDTIRVFVADDDRVVVFDYDVNAPTPDFKFINLITAGTCKDAFQEPYGVAVDKDNNYLYVVDHSVEGLYHFKDINGASPSCDGEVGEAGGKDLDDPQGATVVTATEPNQVVVADSGNDRIVSFVWNAPNLVFSEEQESLDVDHPFVNPFDLAFGRFPDDQGVPQEQLIITFPDIKRMYSTEWPP